MPLTGQGWELHVERFAEQSRPSFGYRRTVSRYQAYRNGAPVSSLTGFFAERQGPGDNTSTGVSQHRRIAAGTYKLATHNGSSNNNYQTIGYALSDAITAKPRPAVKLLNTGARSGILFHPGQTWVWSTGCFNPGVDLSTAQSNIVWKDSRLRVIALIDDLRSFLGSAFPNADNVAIPRATMVVEGEP